MGVFSFPQQKPLSYGIMEKWKQTRAFFNDFELPENFEKRFKLRAFSQNC
jgi:hypothetical protein